VVCATRYGSNSAQPEMRGEQSLHRGQGRSRVLALTVILELMVILYEPCALKGASTVRGGAVRKGLSGDTTCGDTWQVGLRKSQYLACRLLYHLFQQRAPSLFRPFHLVVQNCFPHQSFLDMLPPLLPKGKPGGNVGRPL